MPPNIVLPSGFDPATASGLFSGPAPARAPAPTPAGPVQQVLSAVQADGHGMSKIMIAAALPDLPHDQIHEAVDLLLGARKLRRCRAISHWFQGRRYACYLPERGT